MRKLRAVIFPVRRWGWMAVVAGEGGILRLFLPAGREEAARFVKGLGAEPVEGEPVLEEARRQVLEYFAGERLSFDLPLVWSGLGDFSRRVLRACSEIPFGEVRSYGWVAERAGLPGAARAVGRVLASNPFPLVVPCHRVTKADGSLGGFSGPGGAELKRRLLDFEREVVRRWRRGGERLALQGEDSG